MEISEVRKRVLRTLESAKQQAADRRVRTDAAAKAYETFLSAIAVPIFKQVSNALRAEGVTFNVFTPGGSVRLMSERNADDYVELTLDTDGAEPIVSGHTRRRWSGRIVESEAAVGRPEALTEDEVLTFVLKSIEPLVER